MLESVLYAPDLDAAERFYVGLLELPVVARAAGRHVFFRLGGSMLLIFNASVTSSEPTAVRGQPVLPHRPRPTILVEFIRR